MKKILFLLMTTEKYFDRQENILNTWGKNVDLFFYSEHNDEKRKVIKVCDENDVVIKQTSIFKTIQKKFYNEYEWYFFGDDDTFVNVNLLTKELNNLDKNMVHGSDIFGCWNDLHYPSGGAGFLIHNSIINIFFESINYFVNYGDVCFGLNMKDNNISIQNNENFHSQHPNFYNIKIEDCYKYITFHYVKYFDEFKIMNDICQKNTII